MRKLIGSAVILCAAVLSHAQVPVHPLLQAHQSFVDGSGSPCAGCSLYSFLAGTTTPAPTYTSSAGGPQNHNPIVLDVTGSAEIWTAQAVSYKFVLKDSFGTTVWTADNQPGTIGCPTTGCTFSGPIVLPGDPVSPLQAATKQYVDNTPFQSVTGFGCVPNSTVLADMNANVTCFNTLAALFTKIQVPKGVWNINQTIVFPNMGGFIFEGAGPAATSIIQNTDGIPATKVTGYYPSEWRMAHMTIGFANRQSPAAEGVNAGGDAIFISPTCVPSVTCIPFGPYPTTGGSAFHFTLDDLVFVNSARGADVDKTTGSTIWGYNFTRIDNKPSATGAPLNFDTESAGGEPRPYLHDVYNEATLTTEPMITINTAGDLHIDGVEDVPAGSIATKTITAYSASGSTVTLTAANDFVVGQKVLTLVSVGPVALNNNVYSVTAATGTTFAVTQAGVVGSGSATGSALLNQFHAIMDLGGGSGTVEHFSFENFVISDRNTNQGLIEAENGSITFDHIGGTAFLCPVPYPCNSTQPTLWLVSNNAGDGNVTVKSPTMNLYTGSAPGFLYAARWGSNPLTGGECDNLSSVYTTPSLILGSACTDPTSDTAMLTHSQLQTIAPASNFQANSWAITSAANTSNGATVYTGTFTGCNTSLTNGAPNSTSGHALVSGFVVNAVDNGYFPIVTCDATTLTLKNGAGVAETHAATAVSGINSVGMAQYSRLWDTGGATSTTQHCTPSLQPVYNAATGFWDNAWVTMCNQPPAGSRIFTQIGGQIRIFTQPASGYSDFYPANAYGLSGIISSTSPDATFGSIPALRFYKNAGGSFYSGDFRVSTAGVMELCPSTSLGALQSETPQTDLLCSFMVDAAGNWYNTHGNVGGSTVAIVPSWVTGHHGGASGVSTQLSDGTGTSGHPALYAAGGELTDGPAGVTATVTCAGGQHINSITIVNGIITVTPTCN